MLRGRASAAAVIGEASDGEEPLLLDAGPAAAAAASQVVAGGEGRAAPVQGGARVPGGGDTQCPQVPSTDGPGLQHQICQGNTKLSQASQSAVRHSVKKKDKFSMIILLHSFINNISLSLLKHLTYCSNCIFLKKF